MITIAEETYLDMVESFGGFCLACEAEASGVEPDARNYTCDECGAEKVYGIEKLLIMGELELVDML